MLVSCFLSYSFSFYETVTHPQLALGLRSGKSDTGHQGQGGRVEELHGVVCDLIRAKILSGILKSSLDVWRGRLDWY